MKRSAKVGSLALIAGVLFLGLGCEARGIGDPCIPESIPTTPEGLQGFESSEIYIETSSVQCRTRTCLVFKLRGDPSEDCDPAESPNCASNQPITDETSADRVFCSCRCSAPENDANAPLCECTDGFHCVDILNTGGSGVVGGYCVPNQLCTADEDCESGSCNLTFGTCNAPVM